MRQHLAFPRDENKINYEETRVLDTILCTHELPLITLMQMSQV